MSVNLQLVPPELLTVDDVAARFQVSGRTVRRWVQEQRLRGFRQGHVVRVYADALADALRRGTLAAPERVIGRRGK